MTTDVKRTVLKSMISKVSLAEAVPDVQKHALGELLYSAYELGLISYQPSYEEFLTLAKLGFLAQRLNQDEIQLIKM